MGRRGVSCVGAVRSFEVAPSGHLTRHLFSVFRAAQPRARGSGGLRDAWVAGRWLFGRFDGGGQPRRQPREGRSGSGAAANDVRLSITPGSGSSDTAPNRGITVRTVGGRISRVVVRTGGDPVTGTLNAAGTVWRSTWGLNVSQRYSVTATAAGTSGPPVTRRSSFRTFTPATTFSMRIVEGYRQTYGVGMPIILYFSRPVSNRAAVERALEIRTSKRVVGAWYWDGRCNLAPVFLYFRPRRYWPPHTRVSFTGHLDGVEAAPGVYGDTPLPRRSRSAPR